MHISRRRFLALSATFTVAACSSDGGGEESSASTGSTPAETAPPDSTAPDTGTDTTTPSVSAPDPTDPATTVPAVELPVDPFVLGVASGDPDDTSVVIWTRLAGELPDDGVTVTWTFVGDGGDTSMGTVDTSPELGGAVHALIDIAEPGEYSFAVGDWTSPIGRTAPINPATSEFRMATASCQHFETGFYAAHRDISEWSPDLVVFLGDFIYEGDPIPDDGSGVVVRHHEGPEPTTLDGYRARYATYLSDPQLQACRAAAPWLAIWDDHEVENNYAGQISENDDDPTEFLVRRAAAYRAWWENTPTRLDPPDPSQPDTPFEIHRGIDVGTLVRISALDGRQYRDDQLSTATLDAGPPVEGWDDPTRTMLGAEQEAWVTEQFGTSPAIWNCLAQQTILGDVRLGDVRAILNYDQWDGYHPARERLLATAPANFVTVTGDIHLAGVGNLGPIDAPVGVEFVTTAISSGANVDPALSDVVLGIPAIVDAELEFRGYTRHTITPQAWSAEYRQVVDVLDADSEVRTWKVFSVDEGSPAITVAG